MGILSQMRHIEFLPTASSFESERKKILRRAVTLGAQICAILVPVFGVLDLILKYHIFWKLFAIRFSVTCLCTVIFVLTKKEVGRKRPFSLAAALAWIVCGAIAVMTFIDQGPADPYYAGINLPLLGFGILLPLSMTESLLVLSVTWLFYLIPNALILQPHQLNLFIGNNFFLMSTIIISFISTQFNLQNAKRQYFSRKRLQAAHKKIKKHAMELENKVQERTHHLLQSERLAVVGQLAGGIAHDFNNVLTAILGICYLLLDSMSRKNPARTEIESILKAGKRAADLVRQLLAFSRRQVLRPQLLRIDDVIQEVGKMLHRIIGEDIDLIFITPPRLWNVLADPVQIEQIILNLSINARDAMPEGGKLIIEAKNITLDSEYCQMGKVSLLPGDYVMLSASDTGTGMCDEIKSKIFEPFFTTKERGKGTGLGLSTVYGIVKQSNGDILVYSEEGKGTTFKIYLPRVSEDYDEPAYKQTRTRCLKKGSETILLVEDEPMVRDLTSRMLKKQGYQVIETGSPMEALNISRNYPGKIDLILTDVIMPQMNGKELAAQITNDRKNAKILFISGHADSMIDQHGILKTSFHFLQKPFTMENLNGKIRTLFDN
ncbi:MAG TPA: response regulator [bacterium]|nr:response regulator [bacterium]